MVKEGLWEESMDIDEELPDISAGTNAEVIVYQNILGQAEVRLPVSDLGLKKLLSSPEWEAVCHILEEYRISDNRLCHQETTGKSGTGYYRYYPEIESQSTYAKPYRRLLEFFCKGKGFRRFLRKHLLLI